jgi:hypothetical protein
MAELSKSGTYAKMTVHVWFDKRGNRVHITSQDKSLPKGGLHMTAKIGTQSDTNLRQMLDDFGCGPTVVHSKILASLATDGVVEKITDGSLDDNLEYLETLIEQRKALLT